jgi:hypothetical protein
MGAVKQMLIEEAEREREKEEREFYRFQRAMGIPKSQCLDLEDWEAFEHAMSKDD